MSQPQWMDLRDEAVREKLLRPRTANQTKYFQSVDSNVITLVDGRWGTGKTFIACGLAVKAFREQRVKRIVVCRPQVACGKGLGYFPGDQNEKITPYMRPILDALKEFMSEMELNKHIFQKTVEMASPDLLRGANLPDTFLVGDEAQNFDAAQLRMLITRIGQGSKLVLCGDTLQSDLPGGSRDFANFCKKLKKVKGVGLVTLDKSDNQRNPFIASIEDALDGPDAPASSWYDYVCPFCHKINWYDNGNEGDSTVPDVELVSCWSCGRAAVPPDEDGGVAQKAKDGRGAESGQPRAG